MSQVATLLWTEPNRELIARGPRVLEQYNKVAGALDIFEPVQREPGRFVYTVPVDYAARLLASKPQAFKLLSPAQITVRKLNPKTLGVEYTRVTATLMEKYPPCLIEDDEELEEYKQLKKAEEEEKAKAEAAKAKREAARAKAEAEAEEAKAETEAEPLAKSKAKSSENSPPVIDKKVTL